jgi:hypothetical protein
MSTVYHYITTKYNYNTASSNYDTTSTTQSYSESFAPVIPKNKVEKNAPDHKFYSKTLEKIATSNIISGEVAIFAHKKSLVFKDRNKLAYFNISANYNDPISSKMVLSTPLAYCGYSIIIDAFEYLPNMMDKANLLKEALSVLNPNASNPFVLILIKTPEMVEKLIKDKKYEEFNESDIKGLSVEDVVDIAYFARVNHIEKDTKLETDITCVRAYLNRQG